MKGYIVEIDPQIETALSTVMPGVTVEDVDTVLHGRSRIA